MTEMTEDSLRKQVETLGKQEQSRNEDCRCQEDTHTYTHALELGKSPLDFEMKLSI
jgi:hypothetical protein